MKLKITKTAVYEFHVEEQEDLELVKDTIAETVIALEGERPDIIIGAQGGTIIAVVDTHEDTVIPGGNWIESLLNMLNDKTGEIERVENYLTSEQED